MAELWDSPACWALLGWLHIAGLYWFWDSSGRFVRGTALGNIPILFLIAIIEVLT